MKVRVKKTLLFNTEELQIILAALDNNDGIEYPQAYVDGKKSGEDYKKSCHSLASAIRKEIR